MPLRIAIGTDHGGFARKNELAAALAQLGHDVADCGTYTADSTDYPIYAGRVARAVSEGAADFGIIICKTGNGMSMAANRFRGVRAALAVSPATAKLAREHNDANVLVVGCDHTPHDPLDLAQEFLAARFEGGRHKRRVDMLADFDDWADSPLATVRALHMGQSIWLDRSAPGSFTKSDMEQRVRHEGLRGMFVSMHDRDVRDGAEALLPAFRATGGDDGFACLPAAKLDDIRLRVRTLKLPNAMFALRCRGKGAEAIRALVSEGVSVCATDVVMLKDLEAVVDATIEGCADAIAAGRPAHVARVVAAVDVAAIDAVANGCMDEVAAGRPEIAGRLRLLRDRAALAHCQALHAHLAKMLRGIGFSAIARSGAAPIRLLWRGTAPMSPGINPVYYVNELVAPGTISLVANATWDAMLAGATIVRDRLVHKAGEEDELRELAEAGIDFDGLLAGMHRGDEA